MKAANLREVAVEAFALWLKKHGYPADVSVKPDSAQGRLIDGKLTFSMA